jgi:DNA repair protein RadC
MDNFTGTMAENSSHPREISHEENAREAAQVIEELQRA